MSWAEQLVPQALPVIAIACQPFWRLPRLASKPQPFNALGIQLLHTLTY